MRALSALALLAAATAASAAPAPQAADVIDIPYDRQILPNGLTLVVHEDHKAPVVAVSVWYHVGSKDEKTGKTGFAHLFEHLMFQGSENHKDEFFRPFEMVGATDQNGTTWLDRTNYFETVPTTALDMALWMESDRMGHLLGALGQKELDEQRGVVQNEKRQDENQPYGRVFQQLQAASFPEGHPYHWETIGSMEDLNAASLDDVKQWFRDYYGAANTTIVLAGDIDTKTAREKVQKYFGDIPPGPPVTRRVDWVAARTTSTRDVMQDRVAQVRITRSWNVPALRSDEVAQLELAAQVLGGGKTSRLYERLVYRDKLADDASVSIMPFELASLFVLSVDVKQGVDPAKIEQIVAEEWQRFLDKGPTEDELKRAKIDYRAGFVRALEKVGGGGGKASILATGQVYQGDPGAFKRDLVVIDAANAKTVLAAAQRWITHGDYTLTVEPFPQYQAGKSDVDRAAGMPKVDKFPDLVFPQIQRGKLKNGIEVVLAERHSVPVVHVSMLFDGGYAADQGRKLGTASFTMAMLDEGTPKYDALALARRKEELGAEIGTRATLDSNSVGLNALKSQLKPSLDLYADIVRNATFEDDDMERLRGQWLAGIAQEKTDPQSLALRVLPPLVYGEGHAYAIPLTGSGTEASVRALTPADLRRYHDDILRPDNARILVTGDTTLAEIVPELDRAFGDWKTPGTPIPQKNVADVALQPKPRVFLMDKPGAQQSVIFAGEIAPGGRAPNYLEISTMNNAFGGSFTSRVNMNLREEKHWTYGASSFVLGALGPRMFGLWAPVQTDKTAESVAELEREAEDVVGKKPLTHEEIAKIKFGDVRKLPGRFETGGAVLGALTDIVLFGRGDDYVQTLKQRVEAQTDDAIHAAAKEVIHPQALTWVIVGDLSKIEAGVRALNLGEVRVVDEAGKLLR